MRKRLLSGFQSARRQRASRVNEQGLPGVMCAGPDAGKVLPHLRQKSPSILEPHPRSCALCTSSLPVKLENAFAHA